MGLDFLETVKLKDGKLLHWEWHRLRMEETLFHFYHYSPPESFFKPVLEGIERGDFPLNGEFRYRIAYNRSGIFQIETLPVPCRQFRKLGIVEVERINYRFKFLNRRRLEQIKNRFGGVDEIIIVLNRLVTDTTISNLAFWDGREWLTPSTYLLNGTTRRRLLEEKILREEVITLSDLPFFQKVTLLNALLPFPLPYSPELVLKRKKWVK